MSSTDSCVVNAPRAGPICSAHSSISEPSVLSVAFSSAAIGCSKTGQFSGFEDARCRAGRTRAGRAWSSAGAIAAASNSPSGSAACPGPPASAITALWVGCRAGRFALDRSARSCPAPCRCGPAAPAASAGEAARGSGTGHERRAPRGRRGGRAASRPAASDAASVAVSVRRGMPANVSGSAWSNAPQLQRRVRP